MGNPKDFLAKQIRTNTLILSGGNWARDQYGGTPGLLIYSASVAPDYVGGRPDMFASGSNKFGMVQIYQTDISPSGGFALTNRYGDNLRIHFEKPVLPHNTTYRRGVVSFSISSGSKHHPAITILSGTANSQGCRVFILSQSINGDANTKTDNSVNNPYRMKDVNFWVSGSKGSKVSSGPGYAGNGDYGTAVFGGDLVVSGTLYAEKQVIEVDISQSGSLFVSGSAEIGGGLIVNEHGGSQTVEFRNKDSNNFLYYDPAAESSNGRIGIGNYDWSTSVGPDTTMHIANTDSSTNAPVELLRLTKESSGTPATGLGVKIGFEVETTAGNETLGSLEVISTDVGSGTEDGAFIFKTMTAGATNTEKFRIGADETVVNEGNDDHNFRVEGSSATADALFFVDAGLDAVYIQGATGDDSALFTVQGNSDAGNSNIARLLMVNPTEVSINDSSQDVDFRVESQNSAHAIFVNAGTDQVFILTSSAAGVATGDATDVNFIVSGSRGTRAVGGTYGTALFGGDVHSSGSITADGGVGGWTDAGSFVYPTAGEHVVIGGTSVGAADIYLGGDGAAVFNEQGVNVDFRIEGENDQNLFVVDASADSIGINVAAASHGARLDILANDASELGLLITNDPPEGSAVGDVMKCISGSSEVFSVGSTDVVVNEGGTARDFRVESDNQTNMLYVDGTNNVVGIGTSSPDANAPLHVTHPQNNGTALILIENESGSANDAQVSFALNGTFIHTIGVDDSDSDKLKISLASVLGASNKALMDFPAAVGGEIVINEDGQNHDFRVEGMVDSRTFVVDAAVSNVGIGSVGVPSYKLDVHNYTNPIARFANTASNTLGGLIRLENTRNSGNGVAGDFCGGALFFAPDSAGNSTEYAKVSSKIVSPTNGSEVGSLTFETIVGANSNKGTPLYLQNDRVHILSGGAGVSYDESSGTDVAFFVSGSQNSKGTSERGTTVFGGDVVISGSIFTSGSVRIDKSYGKMQVLDSSDGVEGTASANLPNDTFKLKEGTGIAMSINAGGDTITLSTNVAGTNATPIWVNRGVQGPSNGNRRGTSVITTSSVSFVSGNHIGGTSPTAYDASVVGNDVFFFVSGAIGGKMAASAVNRHGVAVFGGDTFVSGAFAVNSTALFHGNTQLGNASGDTVTFNARVASHVLPSADNTYNLGSAALRFANIYTGDLHLRNDRGNWTIYEEPDMLVVVNNLTGKKYKMGLTPLEDDE